MRILSNCKAKPIILFVLAMFLTISYLFPTAYVFAEKASTLEVCIKNEAQSERLGGVAVKLAYIAYVDSDGNYMYNDDFLGFNEPLGQLRYEVNVKSFAQRLENYVLQNNISILSVITNNSGTAKFDGLKRGMYLVFSTDKSKVIFEPFLVFLPQKINGAEIYDITSQPKTTDPSIGPGDGSSTKKSIKVTVIWDDLDDIYKKRPQSVTVKLLRNGVEYKTAVISESDNWKHTFANLPTTGKYSVVQNTVSEYNTEYSGNETSGFVILNTHREESVPVFSPDEGKFAVTKEWIDNDNPRPDSITLQLIAEGTVVKTVSLNEATGWSYVFDNLSEKIKYTVYEMPVEGYKTSYRGNASTGIVITNEFIGKTEPSEPSTPDYPTPAENKSIAVKKLWNDEGYEDKRPDNITVMLISGGSVYKSAVLNENNGWSYTFTELPSNVTYTICEASTENYTVEYSGNAKDGFVITNTYTEGKMQTPPLEETPPVDIPPNDTPPETESKPTIPQTGTNMIWIYALLIIGILIFLIGLFFLFKEKSLKAYVFTAAGLMICIASVLVYGINDYNDKQAGKSAQELSSLMNSDNSSFESYDDSTVMAKKEVNGYFINGTIEIPKFNISLPVMDEWSYEKLKISPCRYSGTVKDGNLIILAHNYKSHFKCLGETKVDDEVIFRDINDNEYEYKVSKTEILSKDELDRLTSSDFDLTLFTCTPGGTRRIVVRCTKNS